MKIKYSKMVIPTLALLLGCLVTAGAQTLVNGDFENNLPAFPASGFVQIQPYGWGAVTATPYLIHSWDGTTSTAAFKIEAQHGEAFVGLQNNTSVAQSTGIFQTISDFIIGEEYTVSFYVRARNAVSEGGTFTANVSGGTNAIIISGSAIDDGWMLVKGNFIAASTSAQLGISFRSSGGDQMLFVDHVRIHPSAIPEANVSAAFVGMISFALAAFKLRARRR